MGKKAFLVGVNTLGLQYAENDINLMAKSLEQYDFKILIPKNDKWIILKEFEDVIDETVKTDTLIFYFSGHGDISKGKLHLIIGDDLSKSKSIINFSQVAEAFENCRAINKLIILDCCKAGSAIGDWKPNQSESYRLLTASERLEKGKELDEYEASFLTYHIFNALIRPNRKLVDNKSKIRINALYDWIKITAKNFNSNHTSLKVPIPNLLGNQKWNFEIGTTNSFKNTDTIIPFQAITLPDIFIGREKEINLLRKHINIDGSVIFIQGGLGGLGKTTLAAYIAHNFKDIFSDGVLWARLDTDESYEILASFISSFGTKYCNQLSFLNTVESRGSLFRSLLLNRKCLIVLDNAEKINQISPLLPSGSKSTVLVTSRHSLSAHIKSTFCLKLGPLPAEASQNLLLKILVTIQSVFFCILGGCRKSCSLTVESTRSGSQAICPQTKGAMLRLLSHHASCMLKDNFVYNRK